MSSLSEVVNSLVGEGKSMDDDVSKDKEQIVSELKNKKPKKVANAALILLLKKKKEQRQ